MSRLDEARQRVSEAEARNLTNAMGGAPLDETSLSRVYAHWKDRGFAILSADRGERTPQENKRWRKQLKKAIRADGFGFVPIDGFWYEDHGGKQVKVSERSFLVPNRGGEVEGIERLRDGVTRWGRLDRSNPQESVILVSPGGPVEFIDPTNGRVSFTLARFAPGKVADIYSGLRKRSGTFVFEGWRFVAPPGSFMEAARRHHEGEIKFFAEDQR
jgi:hypothetical protein